MPACPACPKTIKKGNFQEKPCFHKMLISWGVTDGTVVSKVLTAAQSSRRHIFGVKRVAGWTADFDVAVSLENEYPYFC